MTDTLSTPKNDQELFDAMNKAVSEGDSKEVDRLMALEIPTETSPDANADPVIPDTPAPPAGASTDTTPPADKNGDTPVVPTPTDAAPPAAPPTPTPEAPVLTAEQITALQNRLHKLESDNGRVNHLQSELARLRKELKTVKKAPAQAAEPQVSEEQRKFQERVEALRKIDPDTAETLELLNKQLLAQQKAAQPKDEIEEVDDEDRLADEKLRRDIEIVESVHPDALPVFQSNQWQQWKATLQPEQLAWAQSSEPGKVIVALNAFKNAMAQKQTPQAPAPVTPPVVPDTPAIDDETNKKIQAERDRKLQEGGGTRNTPIKGSPTVDPDALFKEYYEKIQKDNHIG